MKLKLARIELKRPQNCTEAKVTHRFRDYLSPFATIRYYLQLFVTIRDYSSLFTTIRHYSRLFVTIRDYSPLFVLFAIRDWSLFAIRDYSLFGFSRHPDSQGAWDTCTFGFIRFLVS